jgi:hypothetical protein
MCNRLKEFSSEDFEDVDTPIIYIRKFDEFGLKIMDGGNSSIMIDFCPWCGEKLPESKREKWFDELEKLGIHDPWNEAVPEKFQSDLWYRAQKL